MEEYNTGQTVVIQYLRNSRVATVLGKMLDGRHIGVSHLDLSIFTFDESEVIKQKEK